MFLLNNISSYEARRVVQLGFAVVLILVLVYAFTSLYQIRESTNNLTKIVEINNTKITLLYKMKDVIRQRQILLNFMLASKDPFLREEKSLYFFEIAGDFRRYREKLQALATQPQELLLLNDFIRLIRVAQPINREAITAMMENFESDKARKLVDEAQLAQSQTMAIMEDLIALQIQYESQFVEESKAGYQSVFFWSLFSSLFLISLAAIISRIVSQFVSQKNKELIEKNSELEKVSKQALEGTRIKSEFLATMSHEIRTPLTAIIGFSEMNLHDAIPEDARRRHSQSIVRNGKHLLQVINDILDISKLEADRIEFEHEKFSPFLVMQEVEQIIRPQVNEKGLVLDINYQYPMPEYIFGDALRFKQVILNLCSNAVKFTESGRINIEISCDFDHESLNVEVVDTGIGMTEDQVKKVFDVFTQADSTVTRQYGGTGLGLSLSRQFAEKMGGGIQATSLPGIGSRFLVTVTSGDLSTVRTVQNLDQIKALKKADKIRVKEIKQVKGSILLAEDNQDNQQLFSLLLSKTGAVVDIANNGKEAVEMAMNTPFDLIFMDMQMPIMDGVEATRKLRQKGYTGAIVSLTANAMKQDRAACFKAGCNDYITKPVNDQLLYNTVYQYLDTIDTEPELSAEDDYDLEIKVLRDKFEQNLAGKLSVIQNNFENKQIKEVKSDIHKLKGLGSSMGYPEITEMSEKIEQAISRHDSYMTAGLIEELVQVVEKRLENNLKNKSRNIH